MKTLMFIATLLSATTQPPIKECVVSGCSGQLCVEGGQADTSNKGGISTCEYKPEYECYKSYGRCGIIQTSKESFKCGWEDSSELKNCLSGKQLPLLDEKTGTNK